MRTIIYLLLILLFFSSISSAAAGNTNIDSLRSVLSNHELSKKEEAYLLNEMGLAYYELNEYMEALNYYRSALRGFKLLNDLKGECLIYKHIGNVYYKTFSYDNALKYYFKSLKILESAGNEDVEMLAILLNNTGSVYMRIGNYDKAEEYLDKVRILVEEGSVANKQTLFAFNNLLGSFYGFEGKLESSLLYFNKSLKLAIDTDDKLKQVNALGNIGLAYYFSKDNDKAIEYFDRSIDLSNKIDYKLGVWNSKFKKGVIYRQEKNYERAIELIGESIRFFKENDFQSLHAVYFQLYKIYQETNDKDKALEYYQLSRSVHDSIINIKTLSRVADLEIKYETEKIEKQNEIKLAFIEKERQLSRYKWISAMGILLLILIIIITLYYRNRINKNLVEIKLENSRIERSCLDQEKMHLKDELDFKNNELVRFASGMLKRKNLLEQIKNKIKKAERDQNVELKNILDFISKNLCYDKDQKELEVRIEQAHDSFFYKLKKRYPELTDKDKRMITLILADLSSKEIADLINISPHSVDVARYRLRKKLDIDQNQSITEFLTEI